MRSFIRNAKRRVGVVSVATSDLQNLVNVTTSGRQLLINVAIQVRQLLVTVAISIGQIYVSRGQVCRRSFYSITSMILIESCCV